MRRIRRLRTISDTLSRIAGAPADERFPTRNLKSIAVALPRTSPEAARLARGFEPDRCFRLVGASPRPWWKWPRHHATKPSRSSAPAARILTESNGSPGPHHHRKPRGPAACGIRIGRQHPALPAPHGPAENWTSNVTATTRYRHPPVAATPNRNRRGKARTTPSAHSARRTAGASARSRCRTADTRTPRLVAEVLPVRQHRSKPTPRICK